ncbi:MAG: class I SAM-dependent methyltransferase [Anaerolineae bacterium]|nr:class I SAM-dependent methyltransferase [Anaerolineae bacterium]
MSLKLCMPYDLYERHTVVRRLLHEAIGDGQENVRVLDVGGRAELLEQFVPYHVISVNVDGSGRVLGSGDALPFGDGSFSAVVSIDTLEHVPQARRMLLLRESVRVAQSCVVVAAPFGSEAHRAFEKRLDDVHRSVYGYPHAYLSEHVRYGLPGLDDMDQLTRGLDAAHVKRFFAGDYVWQGEQFERAILAHRTRGWKRRLLNAYNQVTSLALFHPIRLGTRPVARSNRFYLLIQKRQP